MKNKLFLLGMAIVAAVMFNSCGGSSGGAGGGGGEDGGGVAVIDSLSSIPSVDLSEYDSSVSVSGSLAVPKSLNVSKDFGADQLQVGGTSRAGCEQNMQKQEVFRMSQMAQLDRCYPERMEKVGLITAIPTGSYAYWSVIPPEMEGEQETGMCDDIPAERHEERAACEEEMARDPSSILMRLGKIDNQLHIDMCEGTTPTHVNSATYGASGSLYTAEVVRIGEFGGEQESGSFSMSVDVGTNGSVSDNIVTIGDNGYVSAAGRMNGRFGSGNINFERAVDASIKISGAFAGGFEDPFSGTSTSFTGKTYSHVGGTPVTGCAKYSFSGTSPAMLLSDMIPFNISADDLTNFLLTFGAELGIELSIDPANANYYQNIKLCPNPDFRPEDNDPTIKPMVKLASGATSCDVMENTGVECFSITNATTTTDFGTEVSQLFTIIANSAASYFTEVNAFDLGTLSEAVSTIAFPRSWDCTGPFTEVNFASVEPATVETEMMKCMAIEEKANNNEGMGNEGQCEMGQQMDSVNNMAEGGGGAEAFGVFGGDYSKAGDGDCAPDPQIPDHLFVDMIDDDTYCFPMDGTCSQFNVAGSDALSLNIDVGSNVKITEINYNMDVTGATIRFLQNGTACQAPYSIFRPDFSAPSGEFGGDGGGDNPGEAGYMPQPCIDAGLIDSDDGEACHQICMRPGTDCRI